MTQATNHAILVPMNHYFSVFVLVASLVGCTAARSHSAFQNATAAIAIAQELDAQTLAVYEYTRAIEHFSVAKKEANIGQYASAKDHASQAHSWALEAQSMAKTTAKINAAVQPTDSSL